MTDKMTPVRMGLIERCLKDRRPVPRDRVLEMAAEIRRCWAEIERISKYESTICSLEATIVSLQDQLEESKAAAVQWVTYDGTPETLPHVGEIVLWANHVECCTDPSVCIRRDDEPAFWRTMCGEHVDVEIGDRWAYLPTPPEEGKNEIL